MTEPLEIEKLAVHEAVARVLTDLPAIAKNGQAPGNMGGYAFRRVEDITAALKPLFAKYGVLCVPSVMSRVETERATKSGGVMFCVDLEICFRFVGPQGDELAANVWGQGTDSGDKATQKAVTSAFKTMLMVVFCISDSELDAEAHDVPETHRPEPASPERVEEIKLLVLEEDLTEWVRDQGFPWPWTPEACDAIEAKAGVSVGAALRSPEAAQDATEAETPDSPPAPSEPATAAQEPTDEAVAAEVAQAREQLERVLSAEVAKLTTVQLTDGLREAGLSVGGDPKMRRARLVEHRFGEAMSADVI